MFQIARSVGMSLEGMPLVEKAADFLTPYLGKKVEEWPYKQISEWDYKQNELCKDLYRLYLLNPKRSDYKQLSRKYIKKKLSDRFFLLYDIPE